MEVATHWLGARDAARARAALVRAVEESEAVYAYRDATAAGRQALELWPGDEDPAGRLEVLERYARCAELAGELPEAVKAWRELSAVRSARGERLAFADAQRRLAAAHELRGELEAAFAARRVAADTFAAGGRPADAASSGSRWPTTGASLPTSPRRWRSRASPSARPRPPGARTCARGRSGSRASPAPSAASSRPGSRSCARGWRSRSRRI